MEGRQPERRTEGDPEAKVAREFPSLAGRLNLILPTVSVCCPAGHPMKLPAQYAGEGREFYCPRCKRSYHLSAMVMRAARRRAVITPPTRKPAPREMDALYTDSCVPDRLRPALRRLWRLMRRLSRAAVSGVAYCGAALLAAACWGVLLPREILRGILEGRLRRRRRLKHGAHQPPAPVPSAPPEPAPEISSEHLAAFMELARAYPAVAERIKPILLPETEVKCPNGHKLMVLAELARSEREIFCPHCRTAFCASECGAPQPEVETPPSLEETEEAAPVEEPEAGEKIAQPHHRRRRSLWKRFKRRLSRASGWMISCIIHSVLLMIGMLMGIRVVSTARLEKSIIIDADMTPPEELAASKLSEHRDIFKKIDQDDGAESAFVDKMLTASEQKARPAEEATDDLALEKSDPAPAQITTSGLETPMKLINPRQRMSVRAATGEGVTTAVPAGRYAPGVTAGLGPGIINMRGDAKSRLRAARAFGGGADTETAVAMALKWLAARQHTDGSWMGSGGPGEICAQPEPLAATALATLAFLGAGHTPNQDGKYRKTVHRAIQWLIERQRLCGCWTAQSSRQQMHAQGIAALALVEAQMMAPDLKTKKAAQRAVAFIERAQCPYSAWGYNPYKGDGAKWKIENSVTIWNGMALKAAKTTGLMVDGKAFKGMAKWLDDGKGRNGRYSYSGVYNGKDRTRGDGGRGSACMIASSMMMRYWTGVRPGQKDTHRSANLVLQRLRILGDTTAVKNATLAARRGGRGGVRVPLNSSYRVGVYFMHHGTIAMFQTGGKQWRQWNPLMKKLMLLSQHKDGHWRGCRNTTIATALGALTLESYYRYSPLYHKMPKPPDPRNDFGGIDDLQKQLEKNDLPRPDSPRRSGK